MYRAYIDFRSTVRIEEKTSGWFGMTCGIHQGGFLSLTKYVAFINGLLNTLEDSRLCCTISKIPSTPVGYADDVATACVSKLRTDNVLKIVHEYGRKWRFKFNAKKSAILVYGESKKEQETASKFRTFKLGNEKVNERREYDHVGVKACTISTDNERVEEKIGKGRRALNAASGLGIRKCGISMKTCNLIFWTIVMPIITFGCEIWQLNDKDTENLQSFQRYAGRRVQRFPKRSPNSSSYYGLGWIRVETYIQIKKLLFLLTLININDENRIKAVFNERVRTFFMERVKCGANKWGSPIFELLNTASRFGLLQQVGDMAIGGARVVSKQQWARLIWQKGWILDDLFWKSTTMVYKSNDLLRLTVGKSQYLTWWHLADNTPRLQRMCETMARLVCHTSLLRDDDPRCKGGGNSVKNCTKCDLGTPETIKHLVMQCPESENAKEFMFNEIQKVDNEFGRRSAESAGQVFSWLLGRHIEGVDIEIMTNIWIVAGHHISKLYNNRVHSRQEEG